MPTATILHSSLDASVNHVVAAGDGGYWEARYVRRVPQRWICYLSSHSGCNQACRFCHLTATGQTTMRPASIEDYLEQARIVFETHDRVAATDTVRAGLVHFNYMARGEPLANPAMLERSTELFERLGAMAGQRGLDHVHKVSTILPTSFRADLVQVLADPASQLYYSLYSVDEGFRRRWLPRALPATVGLDMAADYQARTGREVVLHWAFIRGENDSVESVERVLDAVHSRGLRAKFNLVRYNPHSARVGSEPDTQHLDGLFSRIQASLGSPRSRIVSRVGMDVAASCGMFVGPGDLETSVQD